jgi:4-hydroxy-3-methylbut-2-en-1-yl diphosphate synthase IspG/GcpE
MGKRKKKEPDLVACPHCGKTFDPIEDQIVECPGCGKHGSTNCCCPGGVGCLCPECEETSDGD